MRRFEAGPVERRDRADGTTGRCHGLLHSGARYVVKDPAAARECVPENAILRRIAADSIEDTGGVFVTTPYDDPDYADLFVAGCLDTGVPVEEIPDPEALRREPRLNPATSRAVVGPDAAMDAWKTVWSCARSAKEHAAQVLTYHRVLELAHSGGRVVGALVRNELTGEELRIRARIVVNASGAWAGQI